MVWQTVVAVAAVLIFVYLLLSSLVKRLLGVVVIFDYERGLKFVHGRLQGELDPGRHFFRRLKTRIDVHDVRPRILQVPGQEVLTADGVSLKISLMATIALTDVELATVGVEDYSAAAYAIFQTALRDLVGGQPINDILEQRPELSQRLLDATRSRVEALGLELQDLNIKDVMFPGALKQLFAQVVDARLDGLAALERARGESAALRSLANSAALLKDHPGLLQLRLIQAISESTGNTFALGDPASTPLPIRDDDN